MIRRAIGFNPILPVSELVKLAQVIEVQGYESLWLHESLFQRDAVSYLTAALGGTSRLKVGSGIINTVTRHPSLTAATFATLAEYSVGRVILGLGLGSFPTLPKIGVKVFPTSENHPLRRVKEYVTIVKQLLKGETVNFKGKFYTVDNLKLDIKLEHEVPIYLAGLFPKCIRMMPKLASGAILSPSLSTPKETTMKTKWVAEELGPGQEFDIASYILTSVSNNSDEASKTVRQFYFFVYQVAEVLPRPLLEPYGVTEDMLRPVVEAWKKGDIAGAGAKIPEEVVQALTITGTPNHCLEKLQDFLRAGVKLPILMPIGDINRAITCFSPGTQT